MTEILLIRHGETDWNVDKRLQGHIDIGLNAEGRRQVQALGAALAGEGIDAIVSSDLQRARDTAQAVASACGLPLAIDAGLRERCYGAFEGLRHSEVEQRYPDAYRQWKARDPLARYPAGERQAETMRQQVDHHLRRARAAARAQGQGERTSVAEVLDELARTLERIFRDRGVAIDWDAAEDLYFLGERQDLLEIAGNAMENACKWGRSKVRVRAEASGPERLRLTIDDDGPGLPEAAREAVLERGARLDESAPGSGLGLSILHELARAYGGSLKLDTSSLGGLRLEVELPRAEA